MGVEAFGVWLQWELSNFKFLPHGQNFEQGENGQQLLRFLQFSRAHRPDAFLTAARGG
jgi:hypothetical protein